MPQLRFKLFNPLTVDASRAANLPHWRQEGAIYFVTFRCADSIPQSRLNAWLEKRHEWVLRHPQPWSEKAKREYRECFPQRIQEWLDGGFGECPFRDPPARGIVEEVLRNGDGKRYELDEFVVMPNHVHALVAPFANESISSILQSWKSISARRINKLLHRSGGLWQKESFDHIVRSEGSLNAIRRYIRENPIGIAARSTASGRGCERQPR